MYKGNNNFFLYFKEIIDEIVSISTIFSIISEKKNKKK